MNIQNARFLTAAVKPEQFPDHAAAEITFVGRSNVGKSSLMNTLLMRKNLVRVGAKPGMTREINFFYVNDALCFVDLPGYGYAATSKGKQNLWASGIDHYLSKRPNLKLIVFLVDIRHTPTKDDQLMLEWLLSSGSPFAVIATKADKLSRSKIPPALAAIRKALELSAEVPVMAFSSETRQGRDELLALIESAAAVTLPEETPGT